MVSPVHNLLETMCKSHYIRLTMLHLLYSSIFLACFNVPTWAEPLVRTVYADSGSLIVEFKLPEPRFSHENSGGQTYSQISFNGAQHTLEIGYPRLPSYSQLIGIPVRTLPHATIIHSRSEIRPTKKILPVQPDHILGSESSLVPRTVRNETNTDFYHQNRFYPTHVVEVVPS